jgi:hypothetical protein
MIFHLLKPIAKQQESCLLDGQHQIHVQNMH